LSGVITPDFPTRRPPPFPVPLVYSLRKYIFPTVGVIVAISETLFIWVSSASLISSISSVRALNSAIISPAFAD